MVQRPPGNTKVELGRMVSVGTKFSAATIALILLFTAGVYVVLSRHQRESLLHAKELAAGAVTQLFTESCAAPVEFEDDAALTKTLNGLGRNTEVEYAGVWQVDARGAVGTQLGQLARGPAERLSRAPDAVLLERRADRVVLTSPVQDQAGQTVAVAVIAFSLAHENAAIAEVGRKTLWMSAAIAASLTALLLAMTRLMIVRPLGKVVVAARKLEKGETCELEFRSNDEIGRLAAAFRSTATAIQNREEHINARNSDMRMVLDNVGQGFVTLDIDAKMSPERSRIVDEWFGAPDPSMSFVDFLQRIDEATAQWFELGWASIREDIMPLEICLVQLPQVARCDSRTFELSYRPIMKGEQMDKAVVVITDVTARIERERAEQAQREMTSVFSRIVSDRQAFDEFFSEGSGLIAEVLRSDCSNLITLTRQIHTLKGTCALMGIESVAAFCHNLEDKLRESPDAVDENDKQTLRDLWENIAQLHSRFAQGGGIELSHEEHDAFVDEVRRRVDYNVLAATCNSWSFEPAAKRLALVRDQIERLSARLGKSAIDVICKPTKLRLPPSKWGPFWSAFAHVIRNAVDHGVETTEERAKAGKSARARVEIGVTHEAPLVVVSVRDDGPGVDWAKMRERAEECGLPHATQADLESALFTDGISSRAEATSTSGRGVGLSAVREMMAKLGGTIELTSQPGKGTQLRFLMPQSMLFDDPAARTSRSTMAPRWDSLPPARTVVKVAPLRSI